MTDDPVAEATYLRYLPQIRSWAGYYALICADRFGGLFTTEAAATAAGVALYGEASVLIRLIDAEPHVGDPPSVAAGAVLVRCAWF